MAGADGLYAQPLTWPNKHLIVPANGLRFSCGAPMLNRVARTTPPKGIEKSLSGPWSKGSPAGYDPSVTFQQFRL